MRDLVLLVPDKNTEHVVRGALRRNQALGIRTIDFKVNVDPGRDGGVRRRGAQILGVERNEFTHAVLVFDYDGSGSEMPPADLEGQIDVALSEVWGMRAKAIVIEPEVDVWLWGAETHIREVVDWPFPERIRDWLADRNHRFNDHGKPERPKEALEAVFRRCQMARSSAQYEAIAQRLSLARCHDPAFLRLRSVLVQWFGATHP